ncbi:hypothetical protein [Parachlamydia sp. AcF125]|nr:hypothetical protein [Parachlamydia sp. AcF125]
MRFFLACSLVLGRDHSFIPSLNWEQTVFQDKNREEGDERIQG